MLNTDNHNIHESNGIHSKYMFVVAAMAVILIGAIAFATDSAFAGGGHGQKKKTEYNQATAQVNDCGNGENPLNVGCQNTASQIKKHASLLVEYNTIELGI